jgi:sugar/nucleoside kinase (ribokinase family)
MDCSRQTGAARVLFIGRTTLDALYGLDRFPEEDSKVYARAFHAAVGGPATNAALTHARLGGESLLLSAVGGGAWGDAVRGELARGGVHLLDLACGTEYETPLTAVLTGSEGASRTIVNPPLSEVELPALPADWREAAPAWGAPPAAALVDGFHLAQTLPLLRGLRAAGTAICLDGGSWKPGTAELAPLLRTAICSERFSLPVEAAGEDGPRGIFAWFAERGVEEIAVTRGPRPIWARDHGREFRIEIEQIEAADTLGAGDVLHGAFSFFRSQGEAFEPALRRAARVATASCKGLGIGGI